MGEIEDKCSIFTCTNYYQVDIFSIHCLAERVTEVLDRSRVEERCKMLDRRLISSAACFQPGRMGRTMARRWAEVSKTKLTHCVPHLSDVSRLGPGGGRGLDPYTQDCSFL